jgi:hypothetical protein
MFDRILLDNDDFLVTSGLLGGIKATLKSRGITVKADRPEKIKLLNVLDELKQRGYSVAPESKEFERIISGFSEALLGRGGIRWQAYFAVSTCEDIVSEVIGELDESNSESRKDSQHNWMDEVRQSLDVTPEKWQKTLDSQMAGEMNRYHKMSELKIMQIDHDFDWNEVYGFCIYREAPALQFRTKNDPHDKTTAYTSHGRYLKISEDGAYWEEIRTILPLIGKSMSKDEFIKFSDDYIG